MAEEKGRFQLLEDVLEPEMVKQYRIRRGAHCVYMPRFGEEKYLCPCGSINPLGKNCYVCGLEPEPLTREVMEQLGREAQARIAEEERQRAQQEERRLAREEALRKTRRARLLRQIAVWAGSAVAVLALGFALFWMFTREWIPGAHYAAAMEALEKTDWQRAHREFTLANSYGDSKEQLARFSTPKLTTESRTVDSATRESFTYDAFGNRLVQDYANYAIHEDGSEEVLEAHTWTNIYERADRPLQLEDIYGKTVYSYNDNGDVQEISYYRADGVQDSYRFFIHEYDELGRVVLMSEICSELISVNYSYEYQENFVYGANGEVLTKEAHANYPASAEGNYHSLLTYTYDDRGRLIATREDVTQTQDQSGDCVKLEQWQYEGEKLLQYNHQVEHGTDQRLNTLQTITYTYDASGRLLKKESVNVFPGDPVRNWTETYEASYDREGRLVWEQSRSVPADAERFALSAYTKTANYTYDLLGRLCEEKWVYDYPETSSMESYATRKVFSYGASAVPDNSEFFQKTPKDRTWVKLAEIEYNENGLEETYTSGFETGRITVRTSTYTYFYK